MAARTRETTAKINDRVRELSFSQSDEPIAFFCECGEEGCYRSVWLTPDEFDRSRALEEPVVAEHVSAKHVAV